MNYRKGEKHEGIDSTYVGFANLSRTALIVRVLKCLITAEEKSEDISFSSFSKCEFYWKMNIFINMLSSLNRAFILYFMNTYVYISKSLCSVSISQHIYMFYTHRYIYIYMCVDFFFLDSPQSFTVFVYREKAVFETRL